MRLYHLTARLFPNSFLAKIATIAGLGVLLPLVAALAMPVIGVRTSVPTLGLFLAGTVLWLGAITVALWAVIAPLRLILNAADSWIAHKAIDPLPDGYDDEFGRVMRRINQMASEAKRQRANQISQADTDPLTGLQNRRGFAR